MLSILALAMETNEVPLVPAARAQAASVASASLQLQLVVLRTFEHGQARMKLTKQAQHSPPINETAVAVKAVVVKAGVKGTQLSFALPTLYTLLQRRC
jgi:hypothetical protein